MANRFPALRSFPPPTVCWWLYGVSSHIGEAVASRATPGTCPPARAHNGLRTHARPGLCHTGSLWRRAHACANPTPLPHSSSTPVPARLRQWPSFGPPISSLCDAAALSAHLPRWSPLPLHFLSLPAHGAGPPERIAASACLLPRASPFPPVHIPE